MWIIVPLTIIAVTCFFLYRRQPAPGVERGHVVDDSEDVLDAAEINTNYRGVSVMPGECPCPAVLDLGRKRFLTNEAPMLPIKDCNQPECNCYYQHFDDRRIDDRRHPFGSLTNCQLNARGGTEQRALNRRASDAEEVAPYTPDSD